MEGDAGCNAIAVDDLGDVANGDGGSLDGFEGEEAVRRALGRALESAPIFRERGQNAFQVGDVTVPSRQTRKETMLTLPGCRNPMSDCLGALLSAAITNSGTALQPPPA